MFKSIHKFFTFFVFITLVHISGLEAAGWGKGQESYQFADTEWTGVYFDMNGLYFDAYIPEYFQCSMENGNVSMHGKIEGIAGYVITTILEPTVAPRTQKEFFNLVKEGFQEYNVTNIEGKDFGAKFAVEMTPKDPDNKIFMRYLFTKDRPIILGVMDSNAERRLNFFESIFIH